MRYAQVPYPIKLRDVISKKEGDVLTFQTYAVFAWLDDLRWETPKSNILRLAKVVPEFEKAPGEWMEFEDQDWEILKTIVETPGTIQGQPKLFQPLVQMQVGPTFEKAILEAKQEDPRKVLANGTKSVQPT
jgi:hypothetical protein